MAVVVMLHAKPADVCAKLCCSWCRLAWLTKHITILHACSKAYHASPAGKAQAASSSSSSSDRLEARRTSRC
jgi:hypothetical protein